MIVGIYISGNNNAGVNPPIAVNIPSVAEPAPNTVNGPLNNPNGAITANRIQRNNVLVGITPPNIDWKNGAFNPATLLNIGSINKNPSKEATSTTPS